MEQKAVAAGAAQITVTRGNPNDEELAAVTALLLTLGNQPAETEAPHRAPARVTRIRKRRALTTPRLAWNIGRR